MKSMIPCLILGISMAANAADWPQFCGPDRNNISVETGLADSWPAGGPKVLWETAVHAGYSGPAIKGGRAYLIDREGETSLLRCLDMNSGRQLWVVSFDDPGKMTGARFAGTRGTPTITDDSAYLLTGYGTLACISLETQTVRWQHNLVSDLGLTLHQWGYAQGPCLYEKLVIVSMASPDAGIHAFDRKTGKKIWASPRFGRHGYASPYVTSICGTDMVLAMGSSEEPRRSRRRRDDAADAEPEPVKELEKGYVVGLSPEDGSILWKYHGWKTKWAIPHPVALPGSRLFVTAGYNAGAALLQIEKKEGGFAVREIYRTDEVGSQLCQPIPCGDHLFINCTSNSRKDGLVAFTLEGKQIWRTRDVEDAPIFERGPFIMADGKIIILDPKSGELYLVKADPEKYTPLASAPMVNKGDMSWAPLALSNGKLLVRDWNTLKCVDMK